MRLRPIPTLSALALVVACGDPLLGSGAAVTTLDPPPGAFNDRITVTLTTDRQATIFATTDGRDSHVERGTRVKGDSKVTIEISNSATLTFHSVTPDGDEEPMRSVQYVRAGGKKGSVSGVIVVDTIALGKPIALTADRAQQTFAPLETKGEIPFTVDGLATGPHRLRALADRDGDGVFLPFLDDASDPHDFELDLADPFKASVEGVRLYLGASAKGLCTIAGTVTVKKPATGQLVRMSALSPDAFVGGMGGGGGGAPGDFGGLLAQLQNGYQLLIAPPQTDYPYSITDLEPGNYMPVPLLTSFGMGGIGLNILANPLRSVDCRAGQVARADFTFGPVNIGGTVRVTPREGAQGFTYGIVAAKSMTFSSGLQAVLMPVLFLGAPDETGAISGTYAGQGLRANANFQLRAFTNADGEEPLLAALAWAVNPLASEPPHATVATQQDDVVQDVTLP